jgi:hypothetical protein
MAKVEFSPLLEGVRGRVGSLVFRRCGQHTVVQRAPDMTGLQASPAQRAQRDRFKRAVAHSRAVLADPAVRALYAARARTEGKSALVLCLRDHLRAPKVEAMDRAGNTASQGERPASRLECRGAAPVLEPSLSLPQPRVARGRGRTSPATLASPPARDSRPSPLRNPSPPAPGRGSMVRTEPVPASCLRAPGST